MAEIIIRLPGKMKGILIQVYLSENDNLRKGQPGVKVKIQREGKSPLIRIYFKHQLPENKKD